MRAYYIPAMSRAGGQPRFHKRAENFRWGALRRELLHAAGYQCAKCRRVRPVHHLEVDHVEPVHRGGELWDRSNLQVLCAVPCHRDKTRAERRTYAKPLRRAAWVEYINELRG